MSPLYFDTETAECSAADYSNSAEKAMKAKEWSTAAHLWMLLRKKFPSQEEGYVRGYIPYMQLGQDEEAARLLEAAIHIFPNSAMPMLGMANLAFYVKCFFETIELTKSIISRTPECLEAYILASKAYVSMSNTMEAEEFLESIPEKLVDNPRLLECKAEISMSLKEWKKADERWRRLRKVQIKNPKGFSQGYIPLKQLKQYDWAEQLLNKAEQLFPKKLFPAIGRAELAMHAGDWEKAARLWDDLRNKYPDCKEAYYRGYLPYAHMGMESTAKEILSNAQRIFQDFRKNCLHMIDLLERMQHPEDALKWCEQIPAKILDKNYSFALTIYRKKLSLQRKLGIYPANAIKQDNPKFKRRVKKLRSLFALAHPGFASKQEFDWSGLSPQFSGFSVTVADFASKYINSSKGVRLTAETPDEHMHSLYFFGDSRVLGVGSPDEDTSASHLQRLINEKDLRIKVVNRGISSAAREDIFLSLQDCELQQGDFVIIENVKPDVCKSGVPAHEYIACMDAYCCERKTHFIACQLPYCNAVLNKSENELSISDKSTLQVVLTKRRRHALFSELTARGISAPDLQSFFDRPHALGEIFFDNHHFVLNGNHKVAEILFNYFILPTYEKVRNRKELIAAALHHSHILKSYFRNNELKNWLSRVPKHACSPGKIIGSIVMNCNPFNNEHKFLIETAAAQCDFLYIFIVQEDRSFFPLKDRLRLVQEGTRHLEEKIIVVPSGSFIISLNTFGEYFSKDTIKTKIDPSQDVVVFGALIAPALGITCRFVGEEPHCNVTRQYNECMLKFLPQLNIDVIVVKRKDTDGIIISVSTVRAYLQKNDFESIRQFVPQVTLDYLIQKRSNSLNSFGV